MPILGSNHLICRLISVKIIKVQRINRWLKFIFIWIDVKLEFFLHIKRQMHGLIQNMLTARSYQTSCSPVVLSSSITTHTVCLTWVNIFHRVWKDTLPRCLCEGEIGKQDWFTRGQDTGKGALITYNPDAQPVTTCSSLFWVFLIHCQICPYMIHRTLWLTGVVLKPKSQVEKGGEAAQPKEVRGCDFLFTEPSSSDHFLQHICLSSAARQQFR